MSLALILVASLVAVGAVVWWRRRDRARRLLEEHSIAPEQLRELLTKEHRPRVFDVRVPLDLLAYSEVIPGSERVAPKEIQANPELIPRDVMTVVYCTCPGDETARMILNKALEHGFMKARILRGGLEAWKAKGYPVERYERAFHLDTPA